MVSLCGSKRGISDCGSIKKPEIFFTKVNLTEARLFSDEEVEYRIPGDEFLEITGYVPVNQIYDNNSQNQNLKVELNPVTIQNNSIK